MVSSTSGPSPEGPNEAFMQMLGQVRTAAQQFINGNARPIKELWSQADDVSIFGGGGGQGLGWAQVGPSLDGGATLFRTGPVSGHVSMDTLAMGTSGDLGYTVWIEQGEALMSGQEELKPVALRVTQIYRWEAGAWKIIHRHGDALIGRR